MKTSAFRSSGFTLIELMVTITIAGILAMIAIPSLTTFRRSSELTSVTNKMIGSINAARGEAMKRGLNAFVVPLDNGGNWAVGWAAFVDKTTAWTQTYDPAAEGVVAVQQALPSGITVTGNGTAGGSVAYLMFDASGFAKAKGAAFGALAMEIKRNDVSPSDQPSMTRILIVSSTGRVRVCKPTIANDPNCKLGMTL